MEDVAPALRVLVGGEEHRATARVPLVDDVIEDVRCVVAVREIAHLVDDEDVRSEIRVERLSHASVSARNGEVVDELSGGREQGFETVLQSSVCDGDREMRFTAPRLAHENGGAAIGDEVGRE